MQVATTMPLYGVDVASNRLDELDRSLLQLVSEVSAIGGAPRVLELGAGRGGLTLHLLAAGAQVTAVDCADVADYYAPLHVAYPGQLQFIQTDILSFVVQEVGVRYFDVVSCQRTLHYLQADEVAIILSRLQTMCTWLYLSVTGTESAIGFAHPCGDAPLAERFAILPPAAQKTFSISAPLCPYTSAEVQDVLMYAGWHITFFRTSAFGNHKIIAQNTRPA